MKKVLIFGIGGFVGYYLALEFINHGYIVYGSDIQKNDGVPKEVDFYEADITNAEIVEILIKEVSPDIIINLAAISNVGTSWIIPKTTVEVNVIGTLNIMEAAKKLVNLPRILIVGSSEEYENSCKPLDESTPLNANNPYGISKMTQEKFSQIYKERYGMKIYCVRPFNHTGVGQKDSFVLPSFCRQVAEIEKSGQAGVIKVGNLQAKRDFSNVKDIVRAYRMIVESDNDIEVYNVGSGVVYRLSEILDYILSLSTQKITVEVDLGRFRPIDTEVICCDNSKIKKELGWQPEYSIFDTLKEMFEDYLKR